MSRKALRPWALLLSFAIALLTAVMVAAPASAASVSGSISSPVGTGFYFGSVYFIKNGNTQFTTPISSTGAFSTSVPDGIYDVQVSAELYPTGQGPTAPASTSMPRARMSTSPAGPPWRSTCRATPVTLELHDTTGAAVTAQTQITCTATSGSDEFRLNSTVTGTETVVAMGAARLHGPVLRLRPGGRRPAVCMTKPPSPLPDQTP